ncbi:olfactory receptor 2D2-like [Microcaecilia unicolor]|uniref:Olfactory receptor n=1 Tax=Microcaecilia unicolor TaxID=1415580 RepID=A0A6P7XC25_9AMPH|nr:olfactory receptor 2D2-like [Microcaecilia unicolor]
MDSENQTQVTEFILLGITDKQELEFILFGVLLPVYLITLSANMLIIMVVLVNRHLQTPMYFFLCNLSFLDICYSSTSLPKSLKDFFLERKTISFGGCMAQMYISLSLGMVECFLLAVMACDRYVAICHPLNYTIIMNWAVCIKIAISAWVAGFLLSVISLIFTVFLPFCGHNRINHSTCEIRAVVILACADIRLMELIGFVTSVFVLIVPFCIIIFSYAQIIVAILKISSVDGRFKAFSTCTSHLTVVILFYGTAIVTYLRPRSMVSEEKDKIVSMFYGAFIPMLNPLIYTLRNNDVKGALRKTTGTKLFSLIGR